MTILADRQIKRMSMRPPFVVLRHDASETFSFETEADLIAKRAKKEIAHYAPATSDILERLNWQPMIAPFEQKNVRMAERSATKQELQIIRGLGNGIRYEPKKAETLQALQEHRSSIKDVRVDPVLGVQVLEKILSYGTSSFGYDVTLQDEFRIFTNVNGGIIDPLNFSEECLVPFKGDVCIIPPNSYILGVTREYFKIPRNVMVACVGKSTYARCGAIVNVTPIEPGFEGHVVIEISNATNLPLMVYANQGVAQFMFFQGDEECETSYADKEGKYQGQTGMTLAKV